MTPSRRFPRASWHFALPWLLLALLGVPACRLTDVPLWKPAAPAPTDAYAVEHVWDVAYYDGPDADAHCHHLDLFLPRGLKDYPVVVLVHGGGWICGDNRACGLYSAVGECLARQGIAAVLPNYRLSPKVKHPEHVKDVARAVAWTRAHIAAHGGCPSQLFVAGHSAGGHLVALLATDETYLRAVGLQTADLQGVIAISGVYQLPPDPQCLTVGGATAVTLHLDEVLPVRHPAAGGCTPLAVMPGLPIRLNIFRLAFGNDPAVRADASPLTHVRPGLPPFLIVFGEKDLPTLPEMAEEFHHALVGLGCDSQLLRVKDRNHNSIVFRAYQSDDPVARAMVEFVRARVGSTRSPQ
jgi:acetyl esterase/lipase